MTMRVVTTSRQVREAGAAGVDLVRLARRQGIELVILEEPDPREIVVVSLPTEDLEILAADTTSVLCVGGCGLELAVSPESRGLIARGAGGPFCPACARARRGRQV